MTCTKATTWAITSYFDPVGDGNRLRVYKGFRERLGLPLITVELSYGADFELGPNDAEHLIQLRGGSVLWQKERLLNIALQALPDECDTVAWLDCDLVFLRDDWAAESCRQLDEFALVQPFSRFYYLEKFDEPKLPEPNSRRCHDSFAARYVKGTVPEECFLTVGSSREHRYSPGGAWVARRKTLESHGFYDAAVIGGGDTLLLAAACARYEDKARAYLMGEAFRSHYFAWAERFRADVQGRISFVEGDLLHLWHGDFGARQYTTRFRNLPRFDFDPNRDLAMTSSGVWSWNAEKPELHHRVHQYFKDRNLPSAPGSETGGPG